MSTQLVSPKQKLNRHKGLVAPASFTPHVDVFEYQDAIVIQANMPGVTAESLDIRVHGKELAVAGTVEPRNADGKWLLQEYEVGSFYRSFQLSDQVDQSKISAELKNGELTIRLPKVEAAKPLKIEVKSDS
jgi:HSP20 family protein